MSGYESDSVDGRIRFVYATRERRYFCIRIKKFADTNISGYAWTGPLTHRMYCIILWEIINSTQLNKLYIFNYIPKQRILKVGTPIAINYRENKRYA